jgi:hypothetical protein
MRRRARLPSRTLLTLYQRDSGCCRLCGQAVTPADATADHILPHVYGGSDDLANLQLAHARCNSAKGDRLRGSAAHGHLAELLRDTQRDRRRLIAQLRQAQAELEETQRQIDQARETIKALRAPRVDPESEPASPLRRLWRAFWRRSPQ